MSQSILQSKSNRDRAIRFYKDLLQQIHDDFDDWLNQQPITVSHLGRNEFAYLDEIGEVTNRFYKEMSDAAEQGRPNQEDHRLA